MKIVDIGDLFKLRNGTIFSFLRSDGSIDGLNLKKDTIDHGGTSMDDFFYLELLPVVENGEPPQFSELQVRWGEFDPDAKFLVYESGDRSYLRTCLFLMPNLK